MNVRVSQRGKGRKKMLTKTPRVATSTFEAATGWEIQPQGACKGDVCIPLEEQPGATVDVVALAGQMGLPIARDEEHGFIAIGPESIGNRALTTAKAPEIELPDLDGNLFRLSSLIGQKVIVYAWAPY